LPMEEAEGGSSKMVGVTEVSTGCEVEEEGV
jgi:hypothetical protein